MSQASIHRLDGEREVEERSGGNGGNGRLRAVEDRLTRLEAKFEYLATREDVEKNKVEIEKNRVEIQKVKVWVLSGVLGGMATATLIALAIMRFWPVPPS